jgi:hypothetical protein
MTLHSHTQSGNRQMLLGMDVNQYATIGKIVMYCLEVLSKEGPLYSLFDLNSTKHEQD